ncbi:MAG: hypothetical protein ACRBHB_14860 [Arenicella sp.]
MDPVAAHNAAAAAIAQATELSTKMTVLTVKAQGINQSNNAMQKAAEAQTNNSNQGSRATADTARA